MPECGNIDVRDRLPLLANGALGEAERTAVLDHVAGCAACAAELELVEQVRASVHGSPAIDIERVGAAVQAATRARGRPTPSIGRRRALGWSLAAAAAFLLLAGGVLGRQARRGADVAAVTAADTAVAAADTMALPLDAHLAFASDAELEALLTDLDAIPATLAAEPDAPLSLGTTTGDME